MIRLSFNQIIVFLISMIIAFVTKSFLSSTQSLLWESKKLSQLPHIFASKTTYEDSFKVLNHLKPEDHSGKIVLLKPTVYLDADTVCSPVKVIGIYRHGTRYPTTKNIKLAHNILAKLQPVIDQSKIDQLKSVLDNHMTLSQAGQLAKVGQREHERLGYRIRRRYRSLFDDTSSQVKFVSSSVQRAEDSLRSFYKTFNDQNTDEINFEVRDDLLRFYDHCPEFTTRVKKNKTALVEYNRFLKSITPMINEVIAKNMQAHTSFNLTEDEVMAWYNIAASEVAIIQSYNWLKYLDLQTLQMLEYAVDIEHYWLLGFGYELDYEMSCPLFSHVFHQLDQALINGVNGANRTVGVFYFGHAETLSPLLSLFGFFKDAESLKSDNFERMKNRSFRTTLVSPFANNLQIILYRCGPERSQVKVQFLHKERPLLLPGLQSENRYGFYTYTDVRMKYKDYIDRCHFNSMCNP